MLNATWLETYVTLCDEGHFTRAARRLNMTQPGVSQHLRKLEQQVGQALLSRDGKSFVPTPSGEAVLALGRSRREEERRLRAALAWDDPDTGEATLACSGSLALLLYPSCLTLMRDAPGLQIRLEAAPQSRIVDGVQQGAFDLGIVDAAPTGARLAGTRIGQDELCLILPNAAPAAPDFARLQELGFIAHPDGAGYAEQVLVANYPADFRGAESLRIRSYVNQIGQILEPVAQGIGYTILPRSGFEAFHRRDRLNVVELDEPVVSDLWLIQRKARVLPAQVVRLGDMVRSSFRMTNHP